MSACSGTDVPEYLRYVDELPSASPNKYELGEIIQSGGFGRVYAAALSNEAKESKKFVLKVKIRGCTITDNERMEVHALKTLDQEEHIIKMVDLIRKPHDLIIVMERAKTDLQKVLYQEAIPITEEEKRTILNQLFKGLSAIHNNKIIHRDIKPSNVLISYDGIIKITDFGLSVPLERGVKHSLRGGTLFYKAIELLMGDEEYDEKVDMWASGCCMAELWQRKLLFLPASRTVTRQVAAISEYCSFPTEQEWPGVVAYQYYSPLLNLNHHYKENRLVDCAQRITEGESSAADLLTKLLTLNPKDRISSNEALTHEYFTRAPVEPNVESLVQKMNGLNLKALETSSLH